MQLFPIKIEADIRQAGTLPSEVYRSQEVYDLLTAEMFPWSWQLVTNSYQVRQAGQLAPWVFMEGSVQEPLLAVRDPEGTARVISNVCTHRGNLLVEQPGSADNIRCRYHGRRFGLDGRCEFMPEFQDVADFPGESDHLPAVSGGEWGPLLFASLDPAFPLDNWLEPVRSRMDWMPIDQFRFDPATSRQYHVNANWALYCDNFLEGFHIPYVHPGLVPMFDHKAYRTDVFEYCSVQLGIASPGEVCFALPDQHMDAGLQIAGYYIFLFPNTMLNFYPWGLSVNVVLPQGPARTRIDFLSYVWDESKRSVGAGGDLHTVELEDESVVESVQKGVQSRLYERGRYSPSCEAGVHHFHRLLARFLNGAWERRQA